jgi:hypothetical protein
MNNRSNLPLERFADSLESENRASSLVGRILFPRTGARFA